MSRRSVSGRSGGSGTGELPDGVRQALGKHVKILLRVPIKLEKGGSSDKAENRLLVLTPYRLFIMTAHKTPVKIDHHCHYLDIGAVESRRPNQLVLRLHEGKAFSLRSPGEDSAAVSSEVVDQIIVTLATAIRSIFPGVLLEHVIPKIDVVPLKRIQSVLERKPLDFKDMGPCGGFSIQYACYCDYYSMPYREEVAWDVDTIYFSHDSHELALADFEHLDQRDLICIISALEHNTWFTKLTVSPNTSKLSSDVVDKILAVVAKSVSLQEIYLSSAGLRADFFQRLAAAMTANQYCNLTTLDLSLNFVEERGLAPLAASLSHFPRGPRHLNLSHCLLNGKSVNALAAGLLTNRLSLNSLTYLNLSGNSLRTDEVQSLIDFLAQPNVVSILDLSSTEVASEPLFSALVRGCTAHLTHLNLARNPFSSRGNKSSKDGLAVAPAFKQFFATTQVLKYLNMSHGKLPVEALKALLLGLACNEHTADVELNIGSNSLGAGGAAVMENALPGVKCVSRLDVSENNLDLELASVVSGVARSRSLISLNISKNLPKIKAKDVAHVMEAIVQLIQDEETTLQKLNMSDCKLKTDLNNVINALGSNQCLQVLDISGNSMGDVGARLLAKALQINTRLRTIHLDRNNISLQGYQDITYALQSNYSMRHIPFPTYDLQPAMRTAPDRVDAIVRRMQDSLQRNANPKSWRGRNFRLTQGFLLSSTQQILDKWSAQVQDTLQTARQQPDASERAEELERAEGLVRDAERCKLLLPALHEAAAPRCGDSGAATVDPFQLRLAQMAAELESFLAAQAAASLAAMVGRAAEACPTLLAPGSAHLAELRALAEAKAAARLPPDWAANLVHQSVGVELTNKVNELRLVLANHISDKVIDDVIDGLAKSYKGMIGAGGGDHMGSFNKKRSLTPDVLKSSGGGRGELGGFESDSLSCQSGGGGDENASPSPLSTPQVAKRKSIHDRKLRPKSVVDHAAEDYAPDLLTHMRRDGDEVGDEAGGGGGDEEQQQGGGEGEDRVPELTGIPPQLQHLAKNRPRRPKRHASSGALGQTGEVEAEDLHEGLDSFFGSKKPGGGGAATAPQRPGGSTPVGSPLLEGQQPAAGRSREDVREWRGATGATVKGADKLSPITGAGGGGRTSPALSASEERSHHRGGGLSCLSSATLDEDREPVGSMLQLAGKSPEKKAGMLSPSGRSISDIFGKVAHDKLAAKSTKATTLPATAVEANKLPTPSPFTSRRSETVTEVLAGRRRSFFTTATAAEPTPQQPSESAAVSPDEDGEVSKRSSRALGLSGDVLKEMKVRQQEKRASVIPRTAGGSELPVVAVEKEEESNPFGNVKLRSAAGGRSNLTSPSGESVAEQPKAAADASTRQSTEATETIKHSSSSIIGLRAAAFDSLPSSAAKTAKAAEASESSAPPSDDIAGPKPRPPPKPRPWSLVGVDRKSGEFTHVESSTTASSSNNAAAETTNAESTSDDAEHRRVGGGSSILSSTRGSSGSIRDRIASLNKPEPAGGGAGVVLGSGGSVRDRIANMNKSAGVGGGSNVSEQPTVAMDSAFGKHRKGNSLPRTTAAVVAGSDSASSKNSPKNLRKESDTTDDPRILKLDDDFMYEDTVNV